MKSVAHTVLMPNVIAEAPLRKFTTLEDAREAQIPAWEPTEEQQKRKKRIEERVNAMLKHRFPHEQEMKRSLLEYECRTRQNPDDPRDETAVIPTAFIYVEAKTAEEVNVSQSYEFVPVEEAGDSWKVELLDAARQQAEAKTQFPEKFIEWHRHKNLFGVGIMRTGYRCIKGRIKDPIMGEDGRISGWEEKEVEKYDDLFFDLVSPFQFGIDPNAKSLDEAEDCFVMQIMNWNVFQERYATNPDYSDCDKVKPGKFEKVGDATSELDGKILSEQVLVYEYFNCITDEWYTSANGVEIRFDPLPDEHKQLPFAAIHNHSSYTSGIIGDTSVSSPNTGLDAVQSSNIQTETSFWTKGDPAKIRDLSILRTDFGRAAIRNAKLNGEVIIATAPGKKFDPSRDWRSGDQAVGMMNQFQVVPLNGSNLQNFEYMFNTLDSLMTLTLAVDPRVLGDPKQKTAEEAAIQRETGMMRLMMGMRKNQAGGITRLGKLTSKNIQQYYTIPTLKRLTGDENISAFDEVQNDPETGKPMYGKSYRRISSKEKLKESGDKRRKSKYKLSRSEEGVNSFLARPEYIRTSDVDVRVMGATQAGEIKAVNRQQLMKALEVQVQLLPFIQTNAISKDELANIGELNKRLMGTFDIPDSVKMGGNKGQDTQQQGLPPDKQQIIDQMLSNSTRFANPAPAVQ